MDTQLKAPSTKIGTEGEIKKLATPAVDKLISLGGDGLYLRHRASGKKTFVLRRRVAGVWKITTLGDFPAWSLQRARAAALQPATAPLDKATFGDAAGRFCDEVITARYRSSPEESVAYFTRDCLSLWHKPMSKLTRADLVGVIQSKARTRQNAAAKLLALLKQFSKWAVLHDYVPGDLMSVVTAGTLHMPRYEPRERVLTPEELSALVAGNGRYDMLLRFCLYTGCRIGEALQLTDDQVEIQRDDTGQATGALWLIPQTKNGSAHTLWLTRSALACMTWRRGVVYPTIYSYCKPLAYNLHDLRRTAATLMRQAGVSLEDVEVVLNHSRPKLVRVYQRQDLMPAIKAALLALESKIHQGPRSVQA